MEINIDKNSKLPLYYQLKQEILSHITSEKLKPGDMIPTEKDIEEMGISRTTIRRALSELENEGYLDRVQGKGTFVRIPYIEQYPVLSSFSENMRASGKLPNHRTLKVEVSSPPEIVAKELEINLEVDCLHLQRMMYIDQKPVGYAEIWLPLLYLKGHEGLFTPENLDPHSYYRVLEGPEVGIKLVKGIEVATAEMASESLCKLLEIPINNPVLVVRHIGYDNEDKPIDSLKLVFGGTHYQYRTELFRPPGTGWSGRVFIVNGT